jgi:hypothetical protein
MSNFQVVLFKNKSKRKIINKFVTYKRAKQLFDKLIEESNNVVFDTQYENGKPCVFDLAILEKSGNDFNPIFVTDELGRNIKVEMNDPDWTMIELSSYRVKEFLQDFQTNKKISYEFFEKKYLSKDGLKMLSMLNNKVVLQQDENTYLFSLKNESDCNRFLTSLEDYFLSINRSDVLIVKSVSSPNKKYLYQILEEKGFDKKFLYRKSTTHPSSSKGI